ncbi:hypothetical protein CYMTET_56345 [Cymbomonas tetramitiformis]|uniref:Uncharacterized protein n=1 Tax=Cymbomonas tetramitiformis TaxID=36881 RepID=A0AAE0BCK2_9CHLO|nr:hypothetical protein CYMTET_56345 [Cymbomonas tetramitiformis]
MRRLSVDNPAKRLVEDVNEWLYDTLTYIVEADSPAENFLLGTTRMGGVPFWTCLRDEFLLEVRMPTEATHKLKMVERIDPDFYTAARVLYHMASDL